MAVEPIMNMLPRIEITWPFLTRLRNRFCQTPLTAEQQQALEAHPQLAGHPFQLSAAPRRDGAKYQNVGGLVKVIVETPPAT